MNWVNHHWRGTKTDIDASTLILRCTTKGDLLIWGNDSFDFELEKKHQEMTNPEAMNFYTLYMYRSVSVQRESAYNIGYNFDLV